MDKSAGTESPTERAWPRAWRDARAAMSRWPFGIVVAVFGAVFAFGTFSFVNDPDRSLTVRGLMTAGGAVAGVAAGVVVWSLWFVLATPYRQRNEERIGRKEAEREVARLEERLAAEEDRQAIRDELGLMLNLGELFLADIEDKARWFQADLEALKEKEGGATEADKENLQNLMVQAKKVSQSWVDMVGSTIERKLGRHARSMFTSNTGLPLADPPAWITYDVFITAWQRHERRLRRLHQRIEELDRELRKQ